MFRPEFPNPQFRREHWVNLNGTWSFALDVEDNGVDKRYFEKAAFDGSIEVPFCPESKLSGVAHTDFINACWYAREIEIPATAMTGRVMLHFGAVDYEATVYVNGKRAGAHKGGYTPFALDITALVSEGKNTLVVHARDNTRDPMIPSGKQSAKTASYGCYYTRTTGIWQTVWMEFVPQAYIKSFRFLPDIHNGCVTVEAEVEGEGALSAAVAFRGNYMAYGARFTKGGRVTFSMKLKELHLWDVGCGNLYDVELTFGSDKVYTYFGMREIRIDGRRVLLNGRSVYQRLVLDQGFYPDGIYTAPDEAALIKDIELSLAAGFNGARLHEKVFEPLFLYHADRLGYLVWGEYPNWGLDHTDIRAFFSFYPEWAEEIARDFNHPAIVGWCPFNETWNLKGHRQCDEVLRAAYDMTKALDPTRPVIDTSGNCHVVTDIYDVHNYHQDPALLREKFSTLGEGVLWDPNVVHKNAVHPQAVEWDGKQPLFVSEYGGIRWSKLDGWGYGNAPKTEEEFKERYKGLTEALMENPYFFGFCYTQLYDVEQEQNGLYTYEREPKFDMEFFKKVNGQPAAIERDL
ncbi:MAG: beta-galactosidase [Ruminococcaceae bacterium]|nr:beta-galactosidase [Oscillospiraceae bacterium]